MYIVEYYCRLQSECTVPVPVDACIVFGVMHVVVFVLVSNFYSIVHRDVRKFRRGSTFRKLACSTFIFATHTECYTYNNVC